MIQHRRYSVGVIFRFFSIGILMLLAGLVSAQDSTWTATVTPVTDGGLWDICFIDADEGWAVGTDYDENTAVILHTTDAGENWDVQARPFNGSFNTCTFVDADTGYAAGQDWSEGWIALVKTTDGGQNWERQNLPAIHGSLQDVFFSDPADGWMVGSNLDDQETLMLHTSDGMNWEVVDHPVHDGRLIALDFPQSEGGWAVGTDVSITKPIILHTPDGAIWIEQDQPISEGELNEVFFVDETNGYAVGRTDTSSAVLKTTDAGDNWELLPAPESFLTGSALAKSDRTMVALHGDFPFKVTTLHFFNLLCGIVMLNAVQADFSIMTALMTINGGETWFAVYQSMLGAWAYRMAMAGTMLFLAAMDAPIPIILKAYLYMIFNLVSIIMDPVSAVLGVGQQLIISAIGMNVCGMLMPILLPIWLATAGIIAPLIGGEMYKATDTDSVQAVYTATDPGTHTITCGQEGTDIEGSMTVQVTETGVEPVGGAPEAFDLHQNFPNPFNPHTRIGFSVKGRCRVVLTVFDEQGREIATLVDEEYGPGLHYADFNARGFPSGLYTYRIQMGEFSEVKKMVLLE